jgi:hypothetical protein
MKLLQPSLKELCVESLALPIWAVFLKSRPFVMRNSAKFINVSSFTSLLMCNTHFILPCTIYLALSTDDNFVQFVSAKIPLRLPGMSCFGPPWFWLFIWPFQFIRNGLIWVVDFWYLVPCYLMREVLALYFLFLFSVSYTEVHWRVHV